MAGWTRAGRFVPVPLPRARPKAEFRIDDFRSRSSSSREFWVGGEVAIGKNHHRQRSGRHLQGWLSRSRLWVVGRGVC